MSHGVRVDGWDSNKKGLKAVEGRSPSQKYAKNEVNCDHEHSTIRSNSIQFHLDYLREPFDEKRLLFKAAVMEDYNDFLRLRQEDIRGAVNRFERTEMRLRSFGMVVQANDY